MEDTNSSLGNQPCILVTDDSAFFRQVLTDSFESAGYNVLTASDGLEALETIMGNIDSLDAVLIDLVMPEMPGMEVIAEARVVNEGKSLPLVAISGVSSKSSELFALMKACKADGFLNKTTDPENIVNFLNTILHPVASHTQSSLRVSANFKVSCKHQETVFSDRASILSKDGLFVRCEHPMPKGAPVAVKFSLGNKEGEKEIPMALAAEITYTRPDSYDPLAPKGTGLRFLNLDSSQSDILSHHIENNMWISKEDQLKETLE